MSEFGARRAGGRKWPLLVGTLLLASGIGRGDVGVLVPSEKQAPDPAVLALEETAVEVTLEGSKAKVLLRQIFSNRTNAVQEGEYSFSLPSGTMLSDFAVWDGAVRIPGVILERRRAEELYDQIRLQSIDPGLLQLGERDLETARRTSVFQVRVVPIPANGTKRVEIEYHQRLAVEGLQSLLRLPFKPALYRAQSTGKLTVTIRGSFAQPLAGVRVVSASYPLRMVEQRADRLTATMEASNFTFSEDLVLELTRQNPAADRLAVLTHRENGQEPGFLEATLQVRDVPLAAGPGRKVVALFDASLSMQWDKLERSYEAVAKLLETLRPEDQFQLLAFHGGVVRFRQEWAAGGAANAGAALAWLRGQPLRGGTNLLAAMRQAMSLAGAEGAVVLVSDGGANEEMVQTGKLLGALGAAHVASGRPKLLVYAVGDDANVSLLRQLARERGIFEQVLSTEAAEFKLTSFLRKLYRQQESGLQLSSSGVPLQMVYRLEESTFAGGEAAWVARYGQPGRTTLQVRGARVQADLPATSTANPQLPRTWAKARVDALLEEIDRDGETKERIEEIIRLSKRYKFVTPYTSFLAAPRALLRPRLIRPGDPVLRVRTDPAIGSVVAIFPFGLVKPLQYLRSERVWQTRFLAPVDLADGTHPVRLVLRDRNGRTYQESKTFLIASKPPLVRAKLEGMGTDKVGAAKAGQMVRLTAQASATTRTITARMFGAAPVTLRWDGQAKANVGQLRVPPSLPPGKYTITVTAEDIAHNVSSQEVALHVLP